MAEPNHHTLRAEFGFGPAKTRALASQIAHTETLIHEALGQPARHEHQFTLTDPTSAHQLLREVLASPSPELFFRYGTTQNAQWTAWQRHLITAHAVKPESRDAGSGATLRLTTSDALYAMSRTSRVTARKGKISAIVQQIATENGLEAVIEPTSTGGVYTQNFLSDADFILDRMLPRAVSVKGAAQYVVYIRDNVLHFHSPDYQARLWPVDYHASSAYEVASAEHTQKLYTNGVAGVRLLVHDPYTGETREVASDPEKTLRLAETLHPAAMLPNGALNRPYHLSQNEPSEVSAIAQNVYDTARSSAHRISISLTGFSTIAVGDFVDLVYNQKIQAAPLAGLYLVEQATHALLDGALTSTFTLQRGETGRLHTDTVSQSPAGQTRLRLEAPGRRLNRAELQASTRLAGGGNKTSATLLRDVADATRLTQP